VAEGDGRVVGWGALSPFHARSAYRFTVENSVYVDHEYQRRGICDALLKDLIARAPSAIGRSSRASMPAKRAASRFSQRGFVKVAHLKGVGYKFERWLDVVYMQLTVTPLSRDGRRLPRAEEEGAAT